MTALMDPDTDHPTLTPCQQDPEAWFPTGGKIDRATTLCNQCPVKAPCLDYAMRMESGVGRNHRHGIWGGLTVDDRLALERRAAA